MRDIRILHCREVGCPDALLSVYVELCQYFADSGYNVQVINSIQKINNNCIVFMGDTFRSATVVESLKAIAPEAIYIGWYWHRQTVTGLRFIHTYENMLIPTPTVRHMRGLPNSVPLLLRASEDPAVIGTLERKVVRDYCYMGHQYCSDWIPSPPFQGIYYETRTPIKPFVPYAQRREIYLSSHFALGFQSAENIANQHVSQRIFEGLAYGCIVLTNSQPACDQTNGAAVLVTSKADLEAKMRFYRERPEEVKAKQEEGYAFVKAAGTNRFAGNLFLAYIQEHFN